MSSLRTHAVYALLALLGTSSGASATSASEYLDHALNATDVLNKLWYDPSNGQWQNHWWNSANALTSIGDLVAVNPKYLGTYNHIFENTLVAAAASNGGNFLDKFYDDEAWYALAMIQVYDVTANATYLQVAQDIFTNELLGNNAICGGHWWEKGDTSENQAISNELYLALAASLANRVSGQKTYYLNYAMPQIDWFLQSGLINSDNTVYDSVDLTTCRANPKSAVWTYDSGVILGALVELNTAMPNGYFIQTANDIAHGALSHLVNSNNILIESANIDPLNSDSEQFKGIFARNLQKLQKVAPHQEYVTFLQQNADSIWVNARDPNTFEIGGLWQGPPGIGSAPSMSSALDCLIAAAAVS